MLSYIIKFLYAPPAKPNHSHTTVVVEKYFPFSIYTWEGWRSQGSIFTTLWTYMYSMYTTLYCNDFSELNLQQMKKQKSCFSSSSTFNTYIHFNYFWKNQTTHNVFDIEFFNFIYSYWIYSSRSHIAYICMYHHHPHTQGIQRKPNLSYFPFNFLTNR